MWAEVRGADFEAARTPAFGTTTTGRHMNVAGTAVGSMIGDSLCVERAAVVA
jgi:hypothetical protein